MNNNTSLITSVLLPEDHLALIQAITDSAGSLGQPEQTFRVQLPEKGLRWFNCIGQPKRLVDGSLLGNAVKFTERGEVALRLVLLKQENGRQQLGCAVSDTGICLSPEQIGKIFPPFTSWFAMGRW